MTVVGELRKLAKCKEPLQQKEKKKRKTREKKTKTRNRKLKQQNLRQREEADFKSAYPLKITASFFVQKSQNSFLLKMAPKLSEDEIDDLVYLARAGEATELTELLSTLATREGVSDAEILLQARDEGKSTCMHMATGNGHLGRCFLIPLIFLFLFSFFIFLSSPLFLIPSAIVQHFYRFSESRLTGPKNCISPFHPGYLYRRMLTRTAILQNNQK